MRSENVPARPPATKIYHITHVRNLAGIVADGGLWSDAERLRQGLECQVVGMSSIKQRRLQELEVKCHPGKTVGEFVPFYFCPRSVMLYILHRGNHHELEYSEGQTPIVHLEADLREVVMSCEAENVPWAFTNRNAGAFLAEFWNRLEHLDRIDWKAVRATDFRDAAVKEGKQAEFLLWRFFPWSWVRKIGAIDSNVARRVEQEISQAAHRPEIMVERRWYY